jgi:recombinational DNA repair ATPase RecF
MAVCEEFTNTILVDKKNNSVLVNVDSQWFDVLDKRLICMGYRLIHKSRIGEGFTCAYILA